MLEIIAGIGIGLWTALAVTAIGCLIAKRNHLLDGGTDRFLRGDIDSAFERIEDLEEEVKGIERSILEITRRLNEVPKTEKKEAKTEEKTEVKAVEQKKEEKEEIVLSPEQEDALRRLLADGRIRLGD